jgi:quinol monooxygenase YgiN
MAVTVIVEFQATPEGVDDFAQGLHEALPDTRAREGNISVEELRNQDDPCNFVVYQKWESRPLYEAYLNWRMESGMMDQIGPLLTGEPSVRFLDVVEPG